MFPCTVLKSEVICTAKEALPEMRLPSPALPPPTMLSAPFSSIPMSLGMATVPVTSVPILLPKNVLWRPDWTYTEWPLAWPLMRLPSPTTPIRFWLPLMTIPEVFVPTWAVPAALVPIRSPSTVCWSAFSTMPVLLPEMVSPGPMIAGPLPATTWTPMRLGRAAVPPSIRPIRLPETMLPEPEVR